MEPKRPMIRPTSCSRFFAERIPFPQLKTVLTKFISDERSSIDKVPKLLSCTESDILQRHGRQLAKRAKAIMFLPVEQDIANKLAALAARHLVSERFSLGHTGVVFAGFGDKQVFPSLREFYVDGIVMGELKVKQDPNSDTDIDAIRERAIIIPFAIRDMTERFMDGIDRRYQSWIDRTVRGLFEENCMSIVEKYVSMPPSQKRAIKAAVTRAVTKNLDKFMEAEAKYRERRFTAPVMDMVEVLPKEELAHLAESLVNLSRRSRNQKV
jgi:hypothetical protein